MPASAAAVVQRQVEAYNRRDLDAFVAAFHDDVQIFRLPSTLPALVGRTALREFYATHRFNLPKLHAEVRNRITVGNKVVDHEYVTGVGEGPLEVVAAYEVQGSLITTVWFLYPS